MSKNRIELLNELGDSMELLGNTLDRALKNTDQKLENISVENEEMKAAILTRKMNKT